MIDSRFSNSSRGEELLHRWAFLVKKWRRMHYHAANNYLRHGNRALGETICTIIRNVYSLGERRAANAAGLNTSPSRHVQNAQLRLENAEQFN